jgi:tRNA threonylcarbamoyladenosine modification (KEOPS) complex Cgi121 subunit
LLFDLTAQSKLWVSAFEGQVDAAHVLKEAQEKLQGTTIQLFDLDKVAGSRHMLLATFNALSSYNSNRRISHSLAMEILLFVSGTGQIVEAIKRVGISPKTSRTAALALVFSDVEAQRVENFLVDAFRKKADDTLLDSWTKQRRASVQGVYGISNKELGAATRENEKVERAIERLAIERSAMLAIAK